jgi:hypothetical protein
MLLVLAGLTTTTVLSRRSPRPGPGAVLAAAPESSEAALTH